MRGEISTLKDQLNAMQYENDIKVNKLIKRIGFVEDYIQTLSVSVQNMLDISPKYPPSTTIGASTLSSNILPHIQTGTKQQIIITKTPVETPLTELNTPISNSNTLTNNDRDNENVNIGINSTYYDFDLEDDECKNDRPNLSKIPSLRPEANSLDLGGFSDYDGRDTVYSTKTTTPRLQSALSNITSENEEDGIVHLNDPMSPIHEDAHDNINKSLSPFDKPITTGPILMNKYNSSPTTQQELVSKSIPNSPFNPTHEYNSIHKRSHTETQPYEYDYMHRHVHGTHVHGQGHMHVQPP